jgi:flagellar basal body rod protein FlgC
MSIKNLNENFLFNEEVLALREIFNSLDNKKNNKEMNNDDKLLKKYNIKINTEIVNMIHDTKSLQKNRYKFKLQKTFFKKSL